MQHASLANVLVFLVTNNLEVGCLSVPLHPPLQCNDEYAPNQTDDETTGIRGGLGGCELTDNKTLTG